MKNYHVNIAQEMLSLAQKGGDSSAHRRQLYYIRAFNLQNSLTTDCLKIVFWLNLYSAFYLLQQNEITKNKDYYKLKKIKVARSLLSLHDIEHGILRKTKLNVGFGYLKNPFYSQSIKNMAVDQLNYNVHFALQHIKTNSSATIIYDVESLQTQLKNIAITLLQEQTQENAQHTILFTPSFLRQYAGDFGGFGSIKNILQLILNKDLQKHRLRFKKFTV
ncbi:DUF547 domain-containing protein [Flavobacterium sp. K77]|uniref:DUF547 domain-containing protein n=1 Tax=Flavobacterium sp. K77 TaxID=2910676 RepID=UPI001F205516|nr:DUF547 domain-containing protein [Flavobacterium sp. K77]MCF6140630.1 DUF547 domain-containing protein [Flavobacterium sp. K77]